MLGDAALLRWPATYANRGAERRVETFEVALDLAHFRTPVPYHQPSVIASLSARHNAIPTKRLACPFALSNTVSGEPLCTVTNEARVGGIRCTTGGKRVAVVSAEQARVPCAFRAADVERCIPVWTQETFGAAGPRTVEIARAGFAGGRLEID